MSALEIEIPIQAKNIEVGNRITINACYSMNLSLYEYRLKSVPMIIQVREVKHLGTSTTVEAMNHYQFELPSSCWVKKVVTEKETISVHINNKGETFNGVSIE